MTRLESFEKSLASLNETAAEITAKFGKDCIPSALTIQIEKVEEQVRNEKARIEREEKALAIITGIFTKAGLEPVFEMNGNTYYRSGKNPNGNVWGVTGIRTNTGFSFVAGFRDRGISASFGKANVEAGNFKDSKASFNFETAEVKSFLAEIAKENDYISTAEFKFMTREIIRVLNEVKR